MLGNAWEWTDGCASGNRISRQDPVEIQEQECQGHFIRGGAWDAAPDLVQLGLRFDADTPVFYVGFLFALYLAMLESA
jgi:formylglycine-generating enzyme required for sulfatase activity